MENKFFFTKEEKEIAAKNGVKLQTMYARRKRGLEKDVILGIKPMERKKQQKSIHIRSVGVDDDLNDRIDKYCDDNNCNYNEFLKLAIKYFLGENQ